MLTSPVPILVGMRSECFERVKFNDVFAVNIDNGKITPDDSARFAADASGSRAAPATCYGHELTREGAIRLCFSTRRASSRHSGIMD